MLKKILITGFGPFDKNSFNPSELWVNSQLNKNFIEREVKGLILPVTFQTSFSPFVEMYNSCRPDVVLMTGFAQNRSALTLERIGINWIDARIPDNLGHWPRLQKIDESGPDGLFTTIEIEHIQKICPDIKLSSSAGEYVCNALLYQVLHFIKSQGHQTKATFIHIPGADDYENIFKELNNLVENI